MGNRSYEIVKFTKDLVLKGMYIGEGQTASLKVRKGEMAKIYLVSDGSSVDITAIRPLDEQKVFEIYSDLNEGVDTNVLELKNLWVGNYVFTDNKNTFNVEKLPYITQNYLV